MRLQFIHVYARVYHKKWHIHLDSNRFQWIPVDSERLQRFWQLQAYSTGILWNPVDSVLVKFIPLDSSRFHRIPVDTKDSMEVQSGCVWKCKVQQARGFHLACHRANKWFPHDPHSELWSYNVDFSCAGWKSCEKIQMIYVPFHMPIPYRYTRISCYNRWILDDYN